MATRPDPKKRTTAAADDKVWSTVEREAAKETARERKRQAKLTPAEERAAGEADIQAKIAEMPPEDQVLAKAIHAAVAKHAPDFVPRTFYGMPAYARDGKTICFFQSKAKFKVRYSTFGFQPDARLDDGQMWPVAFAVTDLTPVVEARIAELVKQVAS